MGCCPSSEESPYEAPAQPVNPTNNAALPRDSSRAAINQPARSVSNVGSGGGSSILPSTNARPNHPIRPPSPVAKSPTHVVNHPPPWTRRQLEVEREAFFDTRVSGNEEVWKALRVVCEMLRRGDVAEAQGITDAINVTCPNGRIASGRGRNREKGGVYDERGELYDIPAWVLADPEDVIEDEEKGPADGAVGDDDDNVDDDQEETSEAAAQRREEKGKGRVEDVGEIVQLRARLSDRGTDVTVSVGKKQRISVVIKSVQDQIGTKRMRLMYLGKVLEERQTLDQTGWKDGHVVNALVYEGDEAVLSRSR